MSDDQENSSAEDNKEPLPLSLEGGSKQIELEMNPKSVDKKTPVSFNKVSIKNIIDTPKEGPQLDPVSGGASQSQSAQKEDNQTILARLNNEEKGSGSTGTPASPEENKDTADMFIDGFNALFIFFIGIWSKDPDMIDYEVESEEKTKLKKYLAKILTRAENKINPIWIFVGLMAVTYIPMLRKAHKHKKMVEEQRVKDDPKTIILDDEPKRKRRRKKGDDNDAQYYHAEEIK